MKRVLGIVLILLVAAIGITYWYYFGRSHKREKGPKATPVAVSKHSEPFNSSMGTVLDAYYRLSEALVNWDSIAVTQSAGELKLALDTLRIDELQKDTLIYLTALDPLANARQEAATIASTAAFGEKRSSFNTLSDNLRNLLVTVRYDRSKIYWQECPMAFGDDRPGNWLSKGMEVRNPYLGNKHPVYKEKMLDCGGPKDTIHFTATDTLQIK